MNLNFDTKQPKYLVVIEIEFNSILEQLPNVIFQITNTHYTAMSMPLTNLCLDIYPLDHTAVLSLQPQPWTTVVRGCIDTMTKLHIKALSCYLEGVSP